MRLCREQDTLHGVCFKHHYVKVIPNMVFLVSSCSICAMVLDYYHTPLLNSNKLSIRFGYFLLIINR